MRKRRKSEYIITNDEHLLKLKVVEGIKIVTPEDFLKAYNKPD